MLDDKYAYELACFAMKQKAEAHAIELALLSMRAAHYECLRHGQDDLMRHDRTANGRRVPVLFPFP